MPAVKDLATLAAGIAAAIGALVLLVILMWIVSLLAWNGINRLRLVHVLGGRYAISPVKDPPGIQGVGEVVHSRIVDELSFARKSARTLQNVDSPDAAVPAQVPALPDPIKGLGPLVNFLLRQDRLIVSVTILPITSGEAGLHVILNRSTGKALESRRFTEPAQGETDTQAYTGAAIQAGAWLAFMLDKNVRARLRRNGNRRVELLGTNSWLSYAYLCRGLRHARSLEERVAWYNAALREDHRNTGALIELGRLWSSQEGRMDAGIQHLKWARSQLENSQDGMSKIFRFAHAETWTDPQWYQALYGLTVALLHRHDLRCQHDLLTRSPSHPENDCLMEALRAGTKLAHAVGATQLTLASKWRRWAIRRNRRTELRQLLNKEDASLASLAASAKAALEIQQNSGCLLAIDESWHPVEKHDLWQKLTSLSPERLDSLPSARSLLCAQVCTVGKEGEEECHLDQRTRYNRACFYARGNEYDHALKELELVFTHISSKPAGGEIDLSSARSLLDWAEKDDPSLESLRRDCATDFKAIIDDARLSLDR